MDNTKYTYNLEIQVTITKMLPSHGYTGERMNIAQQIALRPQDLTTLFQILGRFQELTDIIKAEQGPMPGTETPI